MNHPALIEIVDVNEFTVSVLLAVSTLTRRQRRDVLPYINRFKVCLRCSMGCVE